MSKIYWSTAPTVFIVAPACPHCGSDDLHRSRTDDNGDGSKTRFCSCVSCGGRFKLVVESAPVSGLDVVWPE